MKDITKVVGLDVSEDFIAVAIADVGSREAARYYGEVPNTPEAVRKLFSKLGNASEIEACYEAGPTGYELQRLLTQLGVRCIVVAPTLIPKRPGERIKTDRRDALRLAQLFRAGELTPVYVPTREDEGIRDLVRAREDAKEDQLRARHRLSKFLLRHDIKPKQKMTTWKTRYRAWLDTLKFENRYEDVTFREYLHAIDEVEQRIKRLETEIHHAAETSSHAPLIQALQSLRGVKETTAVTIVAEIGDFRRFVNPRQFMGYTGLVPSEHSSGSVKRKGRITKTGNTHLRRVLVESAWSYRYRPAVKGEIRKRQQGQPAEVQRISWKAQNRLHNKYTRLVSKGKPSNQAITAVARELAGFMWAIARQMQKDKA
ncbi:IS110 family transposase [Alicyclobacillus fastidiosus]|uniref:IS110 family transposase n=1 Tax=Alicyclobacillus fastidiosus TaxID=392011 RepID=A0ABY6ZM94_9BACL|nr:IS110 family transposase [Alicyclobacillus fastidiosus]WAH43085.1 IS110 family transposase [Alicyclobacillus fastidiosus]GMA65075.1 IS110 family transposase [Alicyclobacillus fastidiosus]